MNFKEAIEKYIGEHEGGKYNKVYLDSVKIITIGIGFNLKKPGAKERIETLGVSYDNLCAGSIALTDAHIFQLFREDIEQAKKDAKAFFFKFNDLSDVRKVILIDMAFNLGLTNLSGFKKFLAALNKQDWNNAADEMVNSKWYQQVGKRGRHNVFSMRNDKIYPDLRISIDEPTVTTTQSSMWFHDPHKVAGAVVTVKYRP